MNKIRPLSIGRPDHKPGYFEVTYHHADGLKTTCLFANGFQDAIVRFGELAAGVYSSIREIDQARFEAWFDVSLQSAQTLQELRTGVHL